MTPITPVRALTEVTSYQTGRLVAGSQTYPVDRFVSKPRNEIWVALSLSEMVGVVWKKSAAVRALWNTYQAYDLVGWEAGRMMAFREGLPDPGPRPNATMLQRLVYAVANRWGYRLFN